MDTAIPTIHMTLDEAVACVISCAKSESEESEMVGRGAKRYPVHVSAEIGRCEIRNGRPKKFHRIDTVWVMDVSESGVSLMTERHWDIKTTDVYWINLRAMVPAAKCQCAGILPVKPQYCVKMLEHSYRLGCKFMTDDDRGL